MSARMLSLSLSLFLSLSRLLSLKSFNVMGICWTHCQSSNVSTLCLFVTITKRRKKPTAHLCARITLSLICLPPFWHFRGNFDTFLVKSGAILSFCAELSQPLTPSRRILLHLLSLEFLVVLFNGSNNNNNNNNSHFPLCEKDILYSLKKSVWTYVILFFVYSWRHENSSTCFPYHSLIIYKAAL